MSRSRQLARRFIVMPTNVKWTVNATANVAIYDGGCSFCVPK